MRKHRTDANHSEVIQVLEDMHCSVIDLSAAPRLCSRNKGASDLLVGICGRNKLLEVKDEDNDYSESQILFNMRWKGDPPAKVNTVQEVINFVLMVRAEEIKRMRTIKI